MSIIDLREAPPDEITIRFDVPRNELDAKTFSEVLAGFSEAIAQIGHHLNPDNPIEVYLADVTHGSVLAKLKLRPRTLAIAAAGFVAGQIIVPIIPSILSTLITDAFKDSQTVVTVTKETITFKTPDITFVVDSETYEKASQLKLDPRVIRGLVRALRAAEKDKKLGSISVMVPTCPTPVVPIPRTRFSELAASLEHPIDGPSKPNQAPIRFTRTVIHEVEQVPDRPHIERVTLLIVSAVLHQSRQKWRFLREDRAKISGPINDTEFYRRLERREISLASGDALDVDLMRTECHPVAGAQVQYEIVKVHGVIPGAPRS